MAEESREFLEKLYDNSVENFITGLYNSKILKNTDLDELRVFLDKLEESEEWH